MATGSMTISANPILAPTWGRSFSEDWVAGQRALGVTDLPRAFLPIKRLGGINALMAISNWVILALDAAQIGWTGLGLAALLTVLYAVTPWRFLDPTRPARQRLISMFALALSTFGLVVVGQGRGLDLILYYPLMSMAFFFLSRPLALGYTGILLLLVVGQSTIRLEHPTAEVLVPTLIGYIAITGFVAGMSLVAISGMRQQIKSQVLSRELAEAHTQIDADYKRLTEELELARQVQNRLIPLGTHHLPGLRFYSIYQPASAVGGDYFDCLMPKEGAHSTLLLGDVTGKGAGAALLMAAVKSVANSTESGRTDPARLLETLNTTLRGLSRQMMTLYTLNFAPDGETVLLANAGHLFPYRLRPGAPPQLLDQAQGLPLGALEIQRYTSAPLPVAAGDRLILYTDGIVEAADPAGTLFGFERLEAVLAAHGTLPAPDLAAEILAAVTTFRSTAALSDDITLVIVDIDSAGARR